jgi:hypothetical protein
VAVLVPDQIALSELLVVLVVAAVQVLAQVEQVTLHLHHLLREIPVALLQLALELEREEAEAEVLWVVLDLLLPAEPVAQGLLRVYPDYLLLTQEVVAEVSRVI